ncbi:hypothetical protein GCM10009680_19750 [Streptomyces yatensis]|uniref:Uncharacterized protein n=1 Tax=Streptomyces yatensis TaxID=155177 RepID=A0ABN2H1S8_9ACTN
MIRAPARSASDSSERASSPSPWPWKVRATAFPSRGPWSIWGGSPGKRTGPRGACPAGVAAPEEGVSVAPAGLDDEDTEWCPQPTPHVVAATAPLADRRTSRREGEDT